MSLEYLVNAPISGQLALFTRNWSKRTSSSVIVDILKRNQTPFLVLEPFQISPPPWITMAQEERILVGWKMQPLLIKDGKKLSGSS